MRVLLHRSATLNTWNKATRELHSLIEHQIEVSEARAILSKEAQPRSSILKGFFIILLFIIIIIIIIFIYILLFFFQLWSFASNE